MNTDQIKQLNDFVTSLKSEITQKQLLVDGAEALLKIATDGYKSDQTFIDTEVQKAKAEVADQVATLQSQVEELTRPAEIANTIVEPLPVNETPDEMVTS